MNQNEHKLIRSWDSSMNVGAKLILNNFLMRPDDQFFPHAFLFLGPSGIGKLKLANEFAQKWFDATRYPKAVYQYDFATEGKLDNLRELIKLSSLKAGYSHKQFFIFQNFQLATTSAINALLKTLEEPSGDSVFLLVSNGTSVLPTIASRCVKIRCSLPIDKPSIAQELPAPLARTVERFPIWRTELVTNQVLAKKLNSVLEVLITAQSLGLALSRLTELSELDSSELTMVLQFYIQYKKQALLSGESDYRVLVQELELAHQTIIEINTNQNKKLVLQQLLLQGVV